MSSLAETRLSFDEFLRWTERREGKWELYDGAPVAMAPEQLGHTETKGDVFLALRAAIKASGATCRAIRKGLLSALEPTGRSFPMSPSSAGLRLPGATSRYPNR